MARQSDAMTQNSRGLNTSPKSSVISNVLTRSVDASGAPYTPLDGELIPYVGHGKAPSSTMWAAGSAEDLNDSKRGNVAPLLRMVWGHANRSDRMEQKRVPVLMESCLVELSLYSFYDGGGAINPGDFVMASSNPVAIETGDQNDRWVCDIIPPGDADGLNFWCYGVVVKGTSAEPNTIAEGGNSPILVQMFDAPRWYYAYDNAE